MGSALIDAGDPGMPPGGATDIDGDPRALDGLFDCVSLARRDIGFDEFVGPALKDCIAPDTFVSGRAKVRTRKKRARVSFALASEPGTSLECSLDGAPFIPCSSPFIARLRRGAHTLIARAKDASGNVDPTPASFTTRVRRLRPR